MGGPWQCEPKLDGCRGLLWRRAGRQLTLWSRNSGDPGPVPELTRAAGSLPANTLIDGETVICDESG